MIADKHEWRRAGGDAQIKMMGAASRIIRDRHTLKCPVCADGELRFYYHEFATTPRRSGTVWVWCPQCLVWDHISRVELPGDYHYADPFATLKLKQFDQLERSGFLDRLNTMWDRAELPVSFELVQT